MGAGATVCSIFAGRLKSPVVGQILVSPSCTSAGWWEWVHGSGQLLAMRNYGNHDRLTSHLLKRLFSMVGRWMQADPGLKATRFTNFDCGKKG